MTRGKSRPKIEPRRARRGSRWSLINRRSQLLVASANGVVAGLLMQLAVQWEIAALLGWDVASVFFLARTWTAVWALEPEDVESVATREDPSRTSADLILVLASVVCIVGVGFLLMRAANDRGIAVAGLLATAVGSLVASWFVVHTVFTLRYASLYYSGDDGGIDFHQDERPHYPDFAYMAFTIGMTFQVSDTDIGDSAIRKTALRQALVSYLFGAVLLAMTVNVGASLLK